MTAEPRPSTTAPAWWGPLLENSRGETGERVSGPARDAARTASVLVLLCDSVSGPSVLLQERAGGLRNHPGEIAFPGGAADDADADAAATALREAAEELAVEPDTVAVGGTLPPVWVPVSGFSVTPVLALWTDPHPVTPVDPREVAAAHHVPIAALADPAHRGTVRYPSGRGGPGFTVPGVPLIWGFTAGVLSWLLDLGRWSRPWNTGRVMRLDPR